MKRPKLVLAVVVGIILLVATVAAFWYFSQPGATETTSDKKPQPNAQHESIPKEDLERLETALNGNTVTAQSKALVPELQREFLESDTLALPAGSKLAIDQSTFQAARAAGKVEASTARTKYTLYLVKQNSQWYIYHTDER